MPVPVTRLNAALEGRYAIERELGAGGMATVYLAKDLKHNRNVALKVLKPELAAVVGAERFLAEIETTANLQHPHILPLFDSGEADSFLFYVMPYVEGETLRGRIDREKQLSIEDAIDLAKAIGSALDYAHERGVIHRDIKPENILVHAGQPVVADFGIALAVSAAGGTRLTETGLSLGTPHYMSPEQAMGDRELDARSDLYSLGCMVFEMLVGEPPYTGPTAQAIVAKVITEEPRRMTLHRRTVPPHVEAAVHKSLQKFPADRFQTAAKFVEAMTNPAFATTAQGAPAAVGRTRGVPTWVTATLGAMLVVFGTLALWGWLRPIAKPVTRVSVALPEEESLQSAPTIRLAISPDGSRLVYTGPSDGGSHQLWVRELDALQARPLPGTEEAQAPSISPDGRFVAFASPGANLTVVPIDGGPPRTVVSQGVSPWGTAWGPDGMLYFAGGTGGLHRVPVGGGSVEQLSEPDSSQGIMEHDWPDVLPDGRAALVAAWKGSVQDVMVSVVIFETGEVRPLVTGVYARYLPPGYLVFMTRDGTLSVAPFDTDRLELAGPATAIVEGVRIESNSGTGQFAIAEVGTLIYQGGDGQREQPVWITRDGAATPIDTTWWADFNSLALSPDGSRLAVSIVDETGEHVWVKQLDSGPLTRLTFEGSTNYRPAWTPDGRFVLFVSSRTQGRREVWRKRADGSAQAELVIQNVGVVDEVLAAEDGESFVYRIGSGGTATRDLVLIRPGTDTAPQPLVESRFDEFAPALSPNGRWLAYVSNESGNQEVYVRPFPETTAARWLVSVDGGSEPLWGPRGADLFYRTVRGDAMVVEVTSGPTFAYGTPRLLFRGPEYGTDLYHSMWDVAPGGERFVMIRGEGAEDTELVLVLNWLEELKDRLGSNSP
jgi:serine/threonine-protein kinase